MWLHGGFPDCQVTVNTSVLDPGQPQYGQLTAFSHLLCWSKTAAPTGLRIKPPVSIFPLQNGRSIILGVCEAELIYEHWAAEEAQAEGNLQHLFSKGSTRGQGSTGPSTGPSLGWVLLGNFSLGLTGFLEMFSGRVSHKGKTITVIYRTQLL